MSRACSVCVHPNRAAAIEEALSTTSPVREIATRFGLSRSALSRHRLAHMASAFSENRHQTPNAGRSRKSMSGHVFANRSPEIASGCKSGSLSPLFSEAILGAILDPATAGQLTEQPRALTPQNGLLGSKPHAAGGVPDQTAAGPYPATPSPSGSRNPRFSRGKKAPLRRFRCARFPFYAIGERVKFQAGFFETSDPELQAVVESNDWYGVHVLEILEESR